MSEPVRIDYLMILRKIVIFLLLILPFFAVPAGSSPFELPKVIIFSIASGIIMILFILKRDKQVSIRDLSGYIPHFIIATVTFYHLIFIRTDISIWGNSYRLQGIFLLWNLIIFSVLSAKIKTDDILPYPVFFLILLHLLFSIVIATGSSGRAIGTVGEPNALAATMLFLWPILILSNKTVNWQKMLGSAIILLIVLLTGSRSGIITMAEQAIFLLTYRTTGSIVKSLFIPSIIVIISLFIPFSGKNYIYQDRSEIWQIAWYAGWQNPVSGRGFGNTEIILHKSAQQFNKTSQFLYIDSSHNIFLDWWVQGGIIGTGILIFLVLRTFYFFIQNGKTLEIALLLGIIGPLLFNPGNISMLINLWWIIGQGLIQNNRKQII